jgi:hypothetical protein
VPQPRCHGCAKTRGLLVEGPWMFPACPKGAYSLSQVQRKGVPVLGIQVAPARSRVKSVRRRGSFLRWLSDRAASAGLVQGGAEKDQAMTPQGQVVRGRTGVGRASATGANSAVSRGGPQRARGGIASVYIIFFNRFGAWHHVWR